jgi:hypothetical protein
MPETAIPILTALALLMIKHFVADFPLQTPYHLANKGRYLHPGGLMHSLIHVVLTAPVFLVIAPESPTAAGLILGAEYLIHYHADWAKDNVTRLAGWTPAHASFWWAIGFDQLVHGLTYVGIVWALLTPGLADQAMSLIR